MDLKTRRLREKLLERNARSFEFGAATTLEVRDRPPVRRRQTSGVGIHAIMS